MRTPESLTLRDQLTDVDRLSRELADHLDNAIVPQTHELRRMTRQTGDPSDDVPDITLRNQVATLLKGDDYTRKMTDRLRCYLDSIGKEVRKIVSGV
ncbi:MAG: hypothetical protein DWH91_18905 [Planctomycetota bacterium]|nr:MAG: hypothetical protein DWH91_18905 [Planctomycetota bacterium]